jgi:hypothetical protein
MTNLSRIPAITEMTRFGVRMLERERESALSSDNNIHFVCVHVFALHDSIQMPGSKSLFLRGKKAAMQAAAYANHIHSTPHFQEKKSLEALSQRYANSEFKNLGASMQSVGLFRKHVVLEETSTP